MNKILKIIIATLGATNIIFSAFIPIALVLALIKIYSITGFSFYALIVAGSFSSLYRAIDVVGFDLFEDLLKKVINK